MGIDGAWNAKKNAQFCLIDLIDCETAKIIDFQIVTSIQFVLYSLAFNNCSSN